MRFFFSAGEASGDKYAAALATAFAEAFPGSTFEGIGGRRSAEAGVRIVQDSAQWGAMGIVQGLKLVPRVARGLRLAKRVLASGSPGILIPIDYGFFNIKLARFARCHGWKVLYFIPPGSWRKDKQGADLPALTDAIVTPFPWSAEILNGMGAKAHFFGHPLAELIEEVEEPGERTGVAVLPGSRNHEIEPHLPVLAEALKGVSGPIRFGVAKAIDPAVMRKEWERLGGPAAEFSHDIHHLLKASRAGVICSGTATLEAALCGLPMVVIYRGTGLMRAEFKIRRPKFFAISLPNILLERLVVPELIGDHVNAEEVRRGVDVLLGDSAERVEQVEAFRELQGQLAGSQVIAGTVEVVRSLVSSSDRL